MLFLLLFLFLMLADAGAMHGTGTMLVQADAMLVLADADASRYICTCAVSANAALTVLLLRCCSATVNCCSESALQADLELGWRSVMVDSGSVGLERAAVFVPSFFRRLLLAATHQHTHTDTSTGTATDTSTDTGTLTLTDTVTLACGLQLQKRSHDFDASPLIDGRCSGDAETGEKGSVHDFQRSSGDGGSDAGRSDHRSSWSAECSAGGCHAAFVHQLVTRDHTDADTCFDSPTVVAIVRLDRCS